MIDLKSVLTPEIKEWAKQIVRNQLVFNQEPAYRPTSTELVNALSILVLSLVLEGEK